MGRLFWKIFLGFWLTLVAVSGAVGFAVHWYAQDRLTQLTELATGPWTGLAISGVAAALEHAGPARTIKLLRRWRGPQPAPVFVVGEDGRDLLGRPVPEAAFAQARARLEKQGRAPGTLRAAAPNGSTFYLFVPAQPHRPHRHEGPLRRPFAKPLALRLGVTLGASLLFSGTLAWYLTRPVRHLRTATRQLAQGALETRVMPRIGRRRDEVADLGRDFDHMAARLQALVGAQKRLLHDVSHELRSPLARLQMATSLARQQPAKREAMMERIERETRRLDDLVAEVLTLSRLEAGVCHAQDQYLDLAALVESVVEDARFEAQRHGCRVALSLDGAMPMRGSAELLLRALDNVVRNAIKFTAPGTSVEVNARSERGGSGSTIAVCDRGPGVSEAMLVSMFEPFVRADNAPGGDGFGLGLAIAKRAVEVHGGTIQASNRQRGGLCIELGLPCTVPGGKGAPHLPPRSEAS